MIQRIKFKLYQVYFTKTASVIYYKTITDKITDNITFNR